MHSNTNCRDVYHSVLRAAPCDHGAHIGPAEWHALQLFSGRATLPWQAPQYRPSMFKNMLTFAISPLDAGKISGWQSSQPPQAECLSCEKRIGCTQGNDAWIEKSGRSCMGDFFTVIPSIESTG